MAKQNQAGKENIQTEKTLHLCEQILSVTSEHMSFLDQNYVYQKVNNAYLYAYQKSYHDIVGHSVADLLGAKTFEQIVKEKLDHCLAGEEVHYQAWFSFPQLGQRYMEVTYYPFIDENNKTAGNEHITILCISPHFRSMLIAIIVNRTIENMIIETS